MSKIDIFLLDNSNNTKEEINIQKPKTYQELLVQLRKKIKNLPKYYETYIIGENNEKITINNEDNYKSIEDFLLIKEVNSNQLGESLYGYNYKKFVEDIIINLNGIISKYKGNNIDIYQDNKYFLEINNQIDFYYNIINEIIKSNNKEIKNEDKLELIILFKKLILLLLKKDEENNNTYFGLSKFIQLIKKLPNMK